MVAWNEEGSVDLAIKSVYAQTIFSVYREGLESVKLFVLANGCTDNTVEVANRATQKYLQKCPLSYVFADVREFERPGKAITWNNFVHEVSDKDADYLFMMDADVVINNEETCWCLIESLENDHYAFASTATAVKDLALKKNKTILDRISLAMTEMEHNARFPHLAGGLFCGRASFLRKIWLPHGMLNIDGFISRLAQTSFLTSETLQFGRILAPVGATFLFEAYDRLGDLYLNHCRRYAGSVLHVFIFNDIRKSIKGSGMSVSTLLRERYLQDDGWAIKLCSCEMASVGIKSIPWRSMLLRWSQFMLQPLKKKLYRWPLVLLGTLWQAVVLLGTYYTLKKGAIVKVWKDTKNRRLIDDVRG